MEAFIFSVSSKIECFISCDQFENLINHWLSEKLKLDELFHVHFEAINVTTLAKQHHLNLKIEASTVTTRFSQIEAELAHCEAENSAPWCNLEHIRKKKKKTERLLIAFKELENA